MKLNLCSVSTSNEMFSDSPDKLISTQKMTQSTWESEKTHFNQINQSQQKSVEWWQWFIRGRNTGNSQLELWRNSPLKRDLWRVCLWKLQEWWDLTMTKWFDRERGMRTRGKSKECHKRWGELKTKTKFPRKHHISGYIPLLVSQRNERLETRGRSRGDAIEFHRGFWKTSKRRRGGMEGWRLGNTSPIEKWARCSMLPHSGQRLRSEVTASGPDLRQRLSEALERFNKGGRNLI